MNARRIIRAVSYGATLCVAWLSCASVRADDEIHRIRVPDLMAINAANHFEQIVHDRTDNNQAFAWQSWQIVCNNAAGAVVTFETDHAFINTSDPSCKRNVRLRLRKDVAPNWTLTQNQDLTDYIMGDEVAVVEADTSGATGGTFLLRAEFLEEQFVNTLAGDYDMTITGTIIPK